MAVALAATTPLARAADTGGADDIEAPDSSALETAPAVSVRAGGDVRLRQESFDNIPIRTADPAVTRGGRNDYFRVRTRVGAGIDAGDAVSFDVRATDEFRVRNIGGKSYEFPDEILLDQLKISLRGLFDGAADLTLGRQDLLLGSGRLFAEGTAKDGSRTQFFDGAHLRLRPGDRKTLDVFAFYGSCETDLALGHEHRDLTGLGGGYNGMDEGSAGFFYEDRSSEALGWGLYYVWLLDTSWTQPDGTRMGREDVHTVGARLMPRFSAGWSAELEGAVQASGNSGYDRRAFFGFASLRRDGMSGTGPERGIYASANALYLSGDDPETQRREDFNILYGRYPWISELMLYSFDGDGVGTWRNLAMTWLETGAAWGERKENAVRLAAGPVWAGESDGAGGGSYRGFLESLYWSFPVASGSLGALDGHLFLELYQPGSYYASSKNAFFFRWQLNWTF